MQNWPKKQKFGHNFQKILVQFYSHFKYLLAGFFDSQKSKNPQMLAFSSLFLIFSSLCSFSHFFFLAFFPSHARKKRICEEKNNICYLQRKLKKMPVKFSLLKKIKKSFKSVGTYFASRYSQNFSFWSIALGNN